MKRIATLLICTLIVITSMCIITGATGDNTVECEVNGTKYTVEFVDLTLTEENKTAIANALIEANEPEIMPANILCLFGHDLKDTTATVTQHKASAIAPRCKLMTYDVTYCTRCDYTEQTLLGNSYIYCCPED